MTIFRVITSNLEASRLAGAESNSVIKLLKYKECTPLYREALPPVLTRIPTGGNAEFPAVVAAEMRWAFVVDGGSDFRNRRFLAKFSTSVAGFKAENHRLGILHRGLF